MIPLAPLRIPACHVDQVISAALTGHLRQFLFRDDGRRFNGGATFPEFHKRRDAVDPDVYRPERGMVIVPIRADALGDCMGFVDQIPG